MRIIRDISQALPHGPDKALRGASAAIGNFDGVHLGHQSVIDIARAEAQARKAPLGIVTFEPHPRQFFAPESPAFRLMNADARETRLAKLGVDVLFEVPFDAALASLTAADFVAKILKQALELSHIVVGADFRFGKGREGDAALLQSLCAEHGISCQIAPLVASGTQEVSSTAIRTALSDGRPDLAEEMLGHLHRIEGPVIQGDQRGRELGYPTANMSLVDRHLPKFGVYATKVDVLDGPHAGSYHGATSIGVRPMFGENTPNCETYLFDFKGDLYGAQLSVALVSYLRGEEKFDSLDALITQMAADCTKAREILARA